MYKDDLWQSISNISLAISFEITGFVSAYLMQDCNDKFRCAPKEAICVVNMRG